MQVNETVKGHFREVNDQIDYGHWMAHPDRMAFTYMATEKPCEMITVTAADSPGTWLVIYRCGSGCHERKYSAVARTDESCREMLVTLADRLHAMFSDLSVALEECDAKTS